MVHIEKAALFENAFWEVCNTLKDGQPGAKPSSDRLLMELHREHALLSESMAMAKGGGRGGRGEVRHVRLCPGEIS